MLKRLVGRVKRLASRGEPQQRAANPTPVTDAVPDDWNDVRHRRSTPRQVGDDRTAGPGQESNRSSARPCRVVFRGHDATIDVANGTTVLDAALEAGVDLNHYCGGMCSCGSCRVTDIDGEVSELRDIEEMTLELVREGEQDRLGCQTRILGDVSLTLPAQDS